MSKKQDIDKQIEEIQAVVAKQKEKVAATEKETKRQWITTGSFKLPSGTVNLQICNKEQAVSVMSHILMLQNFHNQACKELDITSQFQIDGFSANDWREDLKKRIALINIKEQKDKLARVEKSLESIMSEDQKRNLVLQQALQDLDLDIE